MAQIIVKTNGYKLSTELSKVVTEFSTMACETMEVKEIEHFYYGDKLVMTSVRLSNGHYGHFNITEKRVSFNGHTCLLEEKKLFANLTWNDEIFNGKLGGRLQ